MYDQHLVAAAASSVTCPAQVGDSSASKSAYEGNYNCHADCAGRACQIDDRMDCSHRHGLAGEVRLRQRMPAPIMQDFVGVHASSRPGAW
jgi:hypothetical protein